MTQAEIEKIVLQHSNWINGVILNSKRTSELEELTTLNSEDEVGLIQKQSEDAKKIKIPLLRGFVGSWNPTTNIPNLSSGNGLILDTYKVSQNGSRDLGSGTIDFNEGDLITYDGSYWIKLTQSSISDIDGLADELNFKADTRTENTFNENQYFERAFSNNEATANNELVRLDQLNSAVSGLNWQDAIDDILDFTISEPTSPTIGDRYINSANGTSSATGQGVTKDNIYEWDGTDWAEFVPVDGWTVFDRAVDQNFTFNGTSWVEFGSTVSHNNTTGLQGGQAGQYFHLSQSQFNAITNDILNIAYRNINNNFSSKQNFQNDVEINGLVSASNLSGTNTGNETKSSIDALGIDAITLQGENGAYYLDYNNLNNKPSTDNYGYFQLQTNSTNRKQIASQNILNFINGAGISISYGSNGAVTISNSITNNNQLTNGAGYVTSSGNTIIGTDDDISNTGAKVIATLVMTDGVITSHTVRTLTLANLGFTGDTDANKITNNNQITNGAGYITSAGNTQLTKEQVEDFVGGMVTGNTETNIAVTYNDTTGKLNFVSVNTQLSNAQVLAITNPLYLGITAKAVDSDKLDGQDSTYYLNYNNFSNTPNLGVYAKLVGGNNFSGNQTINGDIELNKDKPFLHLKALNESIAEIRLSDNEASTTQFGSIQYNTAINTESLKFYVNDESASVFDLTSIKAIFSGNVGIGTVSPDSKLDVTGGNITINTSGTVFADFKYGAVSSEVSKGSITTDGINLKINAVSKLLLLPVGNVGIGTSSPNAKLDVNGNANFSGDVDINGIINLGASENLLYKANTSIIDGALTNITTLTGRQVDIFSYDNLNFRSGTDDTINFYSGTQKTLTIASNGKATFSGDVESLGNYEISRANGKFRFLEEIGGSERASMGSNSSNELIFNVDNKKLALTIKSNGNSDFSGNVIIDGSNSNKFTKQFNYNSGGWDRGLISFNNSLMSTTNGFNISVLGSSTDYTYGYLGFGIYSDDNITKFYPNGNAIFSGNVEVGSPTNIPMNGTSQGQLRINGLGYNGAISLDENAMYIYHNTSLRDLVFGTNETDRLRIKGNGNAIFSGNVEVNGTVQGSNLISTTNLTSVGINSADSNTGANVSAFGRLSVQSNTGSNVSAFGAYSAQNNNSDNVSAFGYASSRSNTGSNLSAFGVLSADSNSGSNVSAFGRDSAINNTFDNVSAFGYNSKPTKANQVMLGDTNVSEVFTYGNFVGSGASFSGNVDLIGDTPILNIRATNESIAKLRLSDNEGITTQFASFDFNTSNSDLKIFIKENEVLGFKENGNATFSGEVDIQSVLSNGSGSWLNIGLDNTNPVRAKIYGENFNANFSLYNSGAVETVKISSNGSSFFNGGNVSFAQDLDVNGNATFSGDVGIGGSIKIKQYSLIDYGNYGAGLGTSLAYQSQNGQHNFIDDNGEVANVRAKYKSSDGSEGKTQVIYTENNTITIKNGIITNIGGLP